MIGPLYGFPKRLSYVVVPSDKILNVSQISITFHRICPPIFIQTWLQQYSRCTFFHSAHCSPRNPICFWSVWCWRTMISGKIFTGFPKFQRTVSANDFRHPIWLQELLQVPLCFLWSFCFARIWLDPLGGWVLHHDCFSMIVSRFAIFTENFVMAVIKWPKFSARGTTLPMRLLHGALVIFVLWQISQFRSFGKWVLTLCLPKSALLAGVGCKRWFMRRTGVWVSVFKSSTRLSLNSCNHSGMSEWHRSHRSWSWSSFSFGFDFLVGLVNSCSSGIPEEHGSHRSCLATISLDTIEVVMVGEGDELEEDVGWSISCLEGVMDVEESKLEEELVDKPGTTIGTKFSVLHCIRIPFKMRCGFWPLIHSCEYPCSSQSFPSDKTAGVSSKDLHCQEYIQLSDKLWPLHASALHHWLLWPSSDFSTSSKVSNSAEFKSFVADHVHRRSRVYNNICFLWFNSWWRRQAPIFRRWEECCLIFLC